MSMGGRLEEREFQFHARCTSLLPAAEELEVSEEQLQARGR